jgi:hypothetical protein
MKEPEPTSVMIILTRYYIILAFSWGKAVTLFVFNCDTQFELDKEDARLGKL